MAADDRGRSRELLDALRRWVDPVVARAGFGWNQSGLQKDGEQRLRAVLYEADPLDFVRGYPESRLPESYGEQWPPFCVDLWLEFEWAEQRTRFDLEALDVVESLRASGHAELAERAGRLTADPEADARTIATALAMVLAVPGPDVHERKHG